MNLNSVSKWDNRIFTNISNAVKALCPNVVNMYSSTSATFPTLFVRLVSGADMGTDLDNSDTGALVAYELTVYTAGGARTQNKNIASLAYTAMKAMGFIEDEFKFPDDADANVIRSLSRYHRFIGSGDDIALIKED